MNTMPFSFPLLEEPALASLQIRSIHSPIRYAKSCAVKQRWSHKVVACYRVVPHPVEDSYKLHRQGLGFVRTLLIDNYDSYTYNIYQELSVVNGVPPVVVRNDELVWDEVRRCLIEERQFDNVVISPGPGTPACPSDIGICIQLLLECKDVPILGICLGHQALGYAHGAHVIRASEPIHGRLSEIEHDGSTLFHGLPSTFKVVRYHSLVVDAATLPEELIPIAWTSSATTHSFIEDNTSKAITNGHGDYHNNNNSCFRIAPEHSNGHSSVLMGIMHSSRPHFGLQFHPESIATSHGRKIFRNFKHFTDDYWRTHAPKSTNADSFSSFKTFKSTFEKPWLNNLALNTLKVSTGLKPMGLRWRKIDHFAARIGGAKRIFHSLFGLSDAENTFWLDSSSLEKGRARFSYMGGKCGPLWKHISYRSCGESSGYLTILDAEGTSSRKYLENGFFDFLNKELQTFCYDKKDFEGLPFDFCGGYVGYIGYNLKSECGSPNRHSSKTPNACFFFSDNFIVVDHQHDDVYLVSLHEKNAPVTSWLADAETALRLLETSEPEQMTERFGNGETVSETGFICEKTKEEYMNDVEKCLNYIRSGESYELCLTTQQRRWIGEMDLTKMYLDLRESNPAPYSAWLNFRRDNLCICCSSPERFLKLDGEGTLEAKPIKGTISRGESREEDEKQKKRLELSEKEQAENLMIVDLLRNDLGRVCAAGTVHVPTLMEVETYATVHTMVSTVRGQRREGVTAVDCVRAAFPAGSMTGAPKLRSMEILEGVEAAARGVYSGSVGFFSVNDTFDLNVVIRTVVVHDGVASVGAGGAVVALSRAEDEHREMMLKTRAPVHAVLLHAPPP